MAEFIVQSESCDYALFGNHFAGINASETLLENRLAVNSFAFLTGHVSSLRTPGLHRIRGIDRHVSDPRIPDMCRIRVYQTRVGSA